ncbi:MAG: hypothetical protein AB1609_06220 [Bacillota bacterium]
MTRTTSNDRDVFSQLPVLQRYIIELLKRREATYARPVRSREIASALNICETYAREQARCLVLRGLIQVRPGPRGGYYLDPPGPATGHAPQAFDLERCHDPEASLPSILRRAAAGLDALAQALDQRRSSVPPAAFHGLLESLSRLKDATARVCSAL